MLARDHGKRVLTPACAALLTLAAGCTGSGSVSPAVSPASHFSALPLAPISGTTEYTTILGPVTGIGSKDFSVPLQPSYILWLGCLGSGGFAVVKSRMLGLDTEMPCGGSGRASGYQFNAAGTSAGQEAAVQVTAPHAAKWELRIDGGQKAS
jgi:hypothetical protein